MQRLETSERNNNYKGKNETEAFKTKMDARVSATMFDVCCF